MNNQSISALLLASLASLTSGRDSVDQGANRFKRFGCSKPVSRACDAVSAAREIGFVPGATVVVCGSPGVVVGLNTADCGFYDGARYSVIVAWKNGVFEYETQDLHLMQNEVLPVVAMDNDCNAYAARLLPFGCHVEVDGKHFVELEVGTKNGVELKLFPLDQAEIHRLSRYH